MAESLSGSLEVLYLQRLNTFRENRMAESLKKAVDSGLIGGR